MALLGTILNRLVNADSVNKYTVCFHTIIELFFNGWDVWHVMCLAFGSSVVIWSCLLVYEFRCWGSTVYCDRNSCDSQIFGSRFLEKMWSGEGEGMLSFPQFWRDFWAQMAPTVVPRPATIGTSLQRGDEITKIHMQCAPHRRNTS